MNIYATWEANGTVSGDATGSCDYGSGTAAFYIYAWNWNTNGWDTVYTDPNSGSGYRSGSGWYNITITDTAYINATTGEIIIAPAVYAYSCNSESNWPRSMCGSYAWSHLYVDYVEAVLNVPDANTTPVCVGYVSSNLPSDWSDVVWNETLSFQARAYSGGSNIPYFPIKLYAKDEYGGEQLVAVGITDNTGTTPFMRVVGGEGYRMNFSRIEAWDTWMINNNAYVKDTTCGSQTVTPPAGKGRDIAVVPSQYTLNLIGSYTTPEVWTGGGLFGSLPLNPLKDIAAYPSPRNL